MRDAGTASGRLTLRLRMVLLASTAVTVILVLGGLGIAWGLQRALTESALEAGLLRAQDIAALATEDALPPVIAITSDEYALVQVVIANRVVASSDNVAGEAPLDIPAPAPGQKRTTSVGSLPIGEGGRFLVASVGIRTPDGDGVVHVAVSPDSSNDAVEAARRVGLIGLPILVILLSGAMWVLVGRTLRPIENIRAEADAIRGDELARRVPEPPSNDEVARLARTVNGMLDRIEGNARRQQRFVGDAAHELRTPIASLRAQLETARDASRPVDQGELTADLLAETLRMQRLTEQLLTLARLDDGPLGRVVAVDLDEVIAAAAADQRQRNSERSIDLQAVRPVQVEGDPTLLSIAVRNLIENAAGHAASSIAVSTRHVGTWATIVVEDDGEGIPAGSREDVFTRFTRLDEARDRASGGAGLGLALVADIVRAHRGDVVIDDSPELGGARFTVRLPQ